VETSGAPAVLGGRVLNGLDLFSGIGGIAVALSPWVHPVAYCENDRYAQAVLLSRMAQSDLPHAPIWDDVRTLSPDCIPGVDIITGGFPCQDISVAGTGAGLDGERSGLFFEIIRLTRELRPRFVFLENVPAITVRGLHRVLMEFTAIGYDCRWTIVSAAEIGSRTFDSDGFYLPTPTASDYGSNNHGVKEGKAESKAESKASLGQMARRNQWPTPVARDWKGQGMSRERRKTREPDNLCSAVRESDGAGSLNPTWVEWLMGYPLEWTALEDWATQWFRTKRKRHSKDLRVSHD
jgi:hypothetical protein